MVKMEVWKELPINFTSLTERKLPAKRLYPADQPYYDGGNRADYLTLFDYIRYDYITTKPSLNQISFFTNDAMYSINLDDYSIQKTSYIFPYNEYELYKMTADAANKRLIFTALLSL